MKASELIALIADAITMYGDHDIKVEPIMESNTKEQMDVIYAQLDEVIEIW